MSVIRRYSRLLVLLPPSKEVRNKIDELVDEIFIIPPEYVETQWFEGYAFSWRSWYGFDNLRNPNFGSFFRFKVKMIMDNFLGDEEDMELIEYVDPDTWNWLDAVKDYDEIFKGVYHEFNRITYVYPYCVYIENIKTSCASYIEINSLPEYQNQVHIDKIRGTLLKLCRRGYFNINSINTEQRGKLYEKVGFKFGEKW